MSDKTIKERLDDITGWDEVGVRPGLRVEVEWAMERLYDDILEAAALIAEAPITGTPHTPYAEGKMDAANIIARDIRKKKLIKAEKKERRLKAE